MKDIFQSHPLDKLCVRELYTRYCVHMEVGGQPAGVCPLIFYPVWVPEIKLRSVGLQQVSVPYELSSCPPRAF